MMKEKVYRPENLVAISRYQNFFPTLPAEIQTDIYDRMRELLTEEKSYCDQGNYEHMAQILTSIAMYEVLQKHGKSEEEAYRIVSEEMWKFLNPAPMQKMAKLPFFLPLMKKVVPAGFSKKSGSGWRYTWHADDAKEEFHFECNACIYEQILGRRGLLKLGAMCCHADIINYGELPYTDFKRTKTLCQGGDVCDFFFVRHKTNAGDGWERSESI
ncbi:MAG: L-2-amino-thiazoline-4-carboxylic acid hydrolase [Lachnospiraceae bacterium]|nr:L-2-amino-thiazoline-4-carboxylic acid hydrolase [Lachnospiraceae bacterium]